MKYLRMSIPDVVLMIPRLFEDNRGFFMEIFREEAFVKNVAPIKFVQDNYSTSIQGTLRGFHYQIKYPQGKLIQVISGTIFDVAIDLRKSSAYFGKWVGIVLSAKNKRLFWIPPGFAHGFYVLSYEAQIIYKCTEYYAPKYERIILWNDSSVAVNWPIIPGTFPLLSKKDEGGISLEKAEVFL